ncbi:MAG: site-2 protease family protein [Nitrospiraceae bacterium]|nr:site-2 protease family protein [Nitrospiraceae bacterium]
MENVLRLTAISIVPILIAVTFHEVAHGFAAYLQGDRTAKSMGRLTLNPIAHIDPIGTVIMPLALLVLTRGKFVFGYAKPVPINPYNFKNPRKGMALSALAGPAMNLIIAIVCGVLFTWVLMPLSGSASPALTARVLSPITGMLAWGVFINLLLAAFNLIPIPPLDGGRVLAGILPARQAYSLEKLERWGFLIVIVLIMTGIAYYFINPLMGFLVAVVDIFTKGQVGYILARGGFGL